MNTSDKVLLSATVCRWTARILSVLIILFWGFFITAGIVASIQGHPNGSLHSMHERLGFALMLAWLLGLALAWKWEFAGATLTLAAILTQAFFINPRVLDSLGMLPPITALLFVFCWWLGRQSSSSPIAVISRGTGGEMRAGRIWAARAGKSSTCHCRNTINRSMTDDTVSNQRRLPDPKICRTAYLGQSLDFSDCLVENPEACKYALRFGSGILCRHPDQRSFEKVRKP